SLKAFRRNIESFSPGRRSYKYELHWPGTAFSLLPSQFRATYDQVRQLKFSTLVHRNFVSAWLKLRLSGSKVCSRIQFSPRRSGRSKRLHGTHFVPDYSVGPAPSYVCCSP